jgi:hypothetical protein
VVASAVVAACVADTAVVAPAVVAEYNNTSINKIDSNDNNNYNIIAKTHFSIQSTILYYLEVFCKICKDVSP